jgi:aspartate racemase
MAMKHIGIVAHSAEGATLCYRTAWMEGVRRLGPHLHPEITMTGVAMGPVLDDYNRDLGRVREVFRRDAEKLAAAGAEFFILPDNTAHIALETAGRDFPIPGLHIGEVLADEAIANGRKKIAVLGTNWTMTGPVYPRAFGRRGLTWEIPDEEDRDLINRVIFSELCLGLFSDASRSSYVRIIHNLAERGCDAVALACTEIPLLVRPEDSPLAVLDSTRLLARAAVDVATGDRLMPTWKAGPL